MKTIDVVEEDFNRALSLAQSAGMHDIVNALKRALDTKREPNMKNISRTDIECGTGVDLDDVIAYSFYDFVDVPAGVNKQKYNGYNIILNNRFEEFAKNAKSAIEFELAKYSDSKGAKVLMFMTKTINIENNIARPGEWADNSHDMPPYDPNGEFLIGNIVLLTPDGRVVARQGWFTLQDISANRTMIMDAVGVVSRYFGLASERIADVLSDDIDWTTTGVQKFKVATEDMKGKIQNANKQNAERFVRENNQQK